MFEVQSERQNIPTIHDEKSVRSKHKFRPEEDQHLQRLVKEFGENSWEDIAELMPGRNPRQCKDRWTRYLSPSVNKNKWTVEEEKLLIKLVKDLNFRWVQIAKRFKGRTDNQIKNKWNTLKKYVDIEKKPRVPKSQTKQSKKIQKVQKEIKEEPAILDVKQESDAPSVHEQNGTTDNIFINLLSSIDNCNFDDFFGNEENSEFNQMFGF